MTEFIKTVSKTAISVLISQPQEALKSLQAMKNIERGEHEKEDKRMKEKDWHFDFYIFYFGDGRILQHCFHLDIFAYREICEIFVW